MRSNRRRAYRARRAFAHAVSGVRLPTRRAYCMKAIGGEP